jgi:penicillin-binding protein 2
MVTSQKNQGTDRTLNRLAIFGIMLVAAFVALFSRLWFLQVLAADQYRDLAQNNRVRLVHSEPERGRILDRNGDTLVENRRSLAVTVDRQVLDSPKRKHRVLTHLSEVLGIPMSDILERLNDVAVSPYKPVAIAKDVTLDKVSVILENQENLPGVDVEKLPVRDYPEGKFAAQLLGYVGQISPDELESDHFKDGAPPYAAGDIVGKSGLEYTYDRYLRGTPEVRKVVVNSSAEVIGQRIKEAERTGDDLMLTIDNGIQRVTEDALAAGIEAARGAGYEAPGGAVVVMDPRDGAIRAMASFPSYNPKMLADGITTDEAKRLFDPDKNLLFNRAIQAQRSPGSTYKVITAGAAMSTGVATPSTVLGCPGSAVYPPDGGSGSVTFNNWTSANFGTIGFPESLEISCDTFYYELGWRMESAFGPASSAGGDGTERFQKYAAATGIGHDTGVDLPNEADGRVPDLEWLAEYCKEFHTEGCTYGWLPGYTINMAIGQGDLVTSPIQMAVAYAAIANGGTVVRPHIAQAIARQDELGQEVVQREFTFKPVRDLPLDDTAISVIQEGLVDVISGPDGTAAGAFAGFPLDQFAIAGKTGTAQLGDTELQDPWFLSYAPADAPEYVIAVYLERAGHGGESAAPIARQIYEGIFGIDQETDVHLGQDASG